MIGYGMGECAYSLVLNSLFSFALLYYTAALGLSPSLTGAALGVAVLLEMVIDPVMGHVSDRTRHRFGRRHPWMLAGGLLMALCFYFLWDVPEALHGRSMPLFAYLVTVNLLLRAGLTMFFVPYLALGFELCPDCEGSSKLQAVRQVMNLAANLAGPALAWSVFFRDSAGLGGATSPGTGVPQNYVHMGMAFSLASLLCVLAALWLTRGWATDTRVEPAEAGKGMAPFLADLRQSFADSAFMQVLGVLFLAGSGMVWASSLQPYVYVCFMGFAPWQTSVAHGSTMIGMAAGGVLSVWISKRFEKKGAVLLGGLVSLLCTGTLATLFLSGGVPFGTGLAFAYFVFFHASFWLGNGIMLPPGISMIADLSARHLRRTGTNNAGAYAALLSLTTKVSISFALLGSGWVLGMIGFSPRAMQGTYTPEVLWRLGLAMFLAGPLMTAAALAVIAPLKNLNASRL
jgi:GPH family glycoside/pentoside/hexuronide:cation symporter